MKMRKLLDWVGSIQCSLMVCFVALSALLALTTTSVTSAETQESYLLGLLRDSNAFRVRVQAALSLGRLKPNDRIVRGLSDALRDPEPSVRISAASALGRLGDPQALSELRRHASDLPFSVRSSVQRAIAQLEAKERETNRMAAAANTARYYIRVENISSKIKGINAGWLATLRDDIQARLQAQPQVLMAPMREKSNDAKNIVASRSLTGYQLRSNVLKLTSNGPGQARAEVSILVESYPGNDLRMMLSGAATVQDAGSDEEAKKVALATAFESALNRLHAALELKPSAAQFSNL